MGKAIYPFCESYIDFVSELGIIMAEPLNILFYPGGGLGDAVVSMPLLYALQEYLGEHGKIDITTGQSIEALGEVYHGIPFIGQILPHRSGAELVFGEIYDVMVIANELVNVQVKDAAQPLLPEFCQAAQNGFKRREKFGIINHVHTLANNQLGNHAVLLGLDRRSLPLYSLGLPHYQETMPTMHLRMGALSALAERGLAPGQYITIQDGWDAMFPLKTPDTRPTKVWSADAWAALVIELKARHPDKKIVQLGSPSTGADIPGVDLNLRGKIALRDAIAILKYTALHVDTEGGLVHMARGLHTRSLVLFGPTNEKFFGYARNKNLVPPCTNCWWLTQDWMSDCVRELPVPECMTHHTPQNVASAVSVCLAENPQPRGQLAFGSFAQPQGMVGIVLNPALADQAASAGCNVTHFDSEAQKNIHIKLNGMSYRQYLARPSNLPAENQSFDQLFFTASADAMEFAGELLEALRVLKTGGHAFIRMTADTDVLAAAFDLAQLPHPSGSGADLILTRTG